jgi:fermentation-respiration switch protein FrsA (DUF1100 family)
MPSLIIINRFIELLKRANKNETGVLVLQIRINFKRKGLFILSSCFVLILIVSLAGCTQFIFQPHRMHYMTPDVANVIYEDLVIQSSDQIELHGWKLITPEQYRGSILFFHGNGQNISSHFANVYWLTEYGYNVYLFDYRGYGKSGGVAALDNIVLDLQAMIAEPLRLISDEEALTIIGHSLGGSLAIYAVANSQSKQRIKSLVTIGAFSDYHAVAQDTLSTSWLTCLFQWPLSFTIDNSYRPLDVIDRVSPAPLMIMHSRKDNVIPYYHAEALFATASQPKFMQPIDSDHNHAFNRPQNRELLLDFLMIH